MQVNEISIVGSLDVNDSLTILRGDQSLPAPQPILMTGPMIALIHHVVVRRFLRIQRLPGMETLGRAAIHLEVKQLASAEGPVFALFLVDVLLFHLHVF